MKRDLALIRILFRAARREWRLRALEWASNDVPLQSAKIATDGATECAIAATTAAVVTLIALS